MKRIHKASRLVKPLLLITLLALVTGLDASAPSYADKATTARNLRRLPGLHQHVKELKRTTKGLKIRLAAGEFDPLLESMPGPPTDRLVIQLYGPGEEGYYIVQFDRPITGKQKRDLEQIGVQIFDYLPDFSFIVKMDEATRTAVESMEKVRWVGIYQPAYKITPPLAKALATEERLPQAEFIVTAFEGEDSHVLAHQIEQIGGDVLEIVENDSRSKIRIILDFDKLEEVPLIAGVKWVEPAPVWELFNDVAAGIMTVSNVWNSDNLFGSGQVVAVADTGLDQGDSDPASLHDDFENGSGASRVSQIFDRVGDGADDVRSGHGTHVAGSVLGNGFESGSNPGAQNYDNSYAGMAPEANLIFQAVENNTTGSLSGIPPILNTLFQEAYDVGARIHTNSWGSSQAGAYTSFSEDVDQFMWNNKDFLVLFAAGNDGVDADDDGVIDPTSLGSPATAKNCITVGATENNRPNGSIPLPGFNSTWGVGWPNDYPANPINTDHVSDNATGMAAFSSRGPCLDGRTKPDIVAPGTNIVSTKSSLATDLWGQGGLGGLGSHYIFSGGTSMSTPLVAGAATLVREFYTDVEAITPSAALIKATLLNGAAEITPGQYGTGSSREIPAPPRPNNVEGWGRLELETSISPSSPKVAQYEDETTGLDTGGTHIYNFTVGDGAVPLKATLVWTDYWGSPVAGGGLVNDLDLILVDPSSTWHYPNNASQRGLTSLIFYDDQGYEGFWRWPSADRGFAVKFTPSSYPAILDKARFFLVTSTTAQFRCNVWDDDGPGETPGTNLFSKDVTPPYLPIGGWSTVDISGVTITDGSLYIELHYTSTDSNNPYLGLDETAPNNSSYVYDSASWSVLPSGGIGNADWAIQAVVTAQDASTPSDRVNNVVGIDLTTPSIGSYSIRVEAYNIPQGPQPYALVVSGGNISALAKGTTPQAPTDLSGLVISPTRVDLSWTDNSADETGFRIERKQGSAGTYQEIGTTGTNENSYSDLTTVGGPTYYYRVRAYNANGDSAPSNEIAVTPGVPDPPTGLSAAAVSYSQINLSWTDNSTGETGFKIQRKAGAAGVWAQIASVGVDETSYADAGCAASTIYYYRVLSYNPAGDSTPSNEDSATTLAIPVGGGGGGGGCFITTATHP